MKGHLRRGWVAALESPVAGRRPPHLRSRGDRDKPPGATWLYGCYEEPLGSLEIAFERDRDWILARQWRSGVHKMARLVEREEQGQETWFLPIGTTILYDRALDLCPVAFQCRNAWIRTDKGVASADDERERYGAQGSCTARGLTGPQGLIAREHWHRCRGWIGEWWMLEVYWRLTTPHKLQGRGALGKPVPGGMGCISSRKPMAAPCPLHAVVRQQVTSRLTPIEHDGCRSSRR